MTPFHKPLIHHAVKRCAVVIVSLACFVIPMTAQAKTETLWVAAYTRPCTGIFEMDCLQVKSQSQGEWHNFYETIAGFNYQKGTSYVLSVEVKQVKNPAADASSLRYRLLRVISQQKITTPPPIPTPN